MANTSFAACWVEVEDTFGPTASSSCASAFDFTLLFEEAILTVLPLGVAGMCCCLHAPIVLEISRLWLCSPELANVT